MHPPDPLAGMLLHALLGHHPLRDEDIHEPLQWFHVLLWQEVIVHGDRDEVDKTAVQFEVAVNVPEWIVPVTVVQVSIASEHLLDDALDVLVIVLRKSRRLADPLVLITCQSGQGLVEIGGARCNWSRG